MGVVKLVLLGNSVTHTCGCVIACSHLSMKGKYRHHFLHDEAHARCVTRLASHEIWALLSVKYVTVMEIRPVTVDEHDLFSCFSEKESRVLHIVAKRFAIR